MGFVELFLNQRTSLMKSSRKVDAVRHPMAAIPPTDTSTSSSGAGSKVRLVNVK